jgi:hypothetical protein
MEVSVVSVIVIYGRCCCCQRQFMNLNCYYTNEKRSLHYLKPKECQLKDKLKFLVLSIS